MKIFKSSSVATLVAICFFFVAFTTQPAEAMSHKSKSAISAPAKSKNPAKKTKKTVKTKKTKKAKTAKTAKKSGTKTTKTASMSDPSAQ